jgi:hypothetical protein
LYAFPFSFAAFLYARFDCSGALDSSMDDPSEPGGRVHCLVGSPPKLAARLATLVALPTLSSSFFAGCFLPAGIFASPRLSFFGSVRSSRIVSMEFSIRENLFSSAEYFSPASFVSLSTRTILSFVSLDPLLTFLLDLVNTELSGDPVPPAACGLTLTIASMGSGVSAVSTLSGVVLILPEVFAFATCFRDPFVDGAFGRAVLCSAAANVSVSRSVRPLATSGSFDRARVRDAGPGLGLPTFFAGGTVIVCFVFVLHGEVRFSSSVAGITP